ncbi:MAG: molybdopterin-guanine dinucleotide biosynthesis protein B [Candidatus Bathyarchaeia archaeon]
MVKIVAIVGGKRSGKTTIIQHLTHELKNRGYRVGSVREMLNVNWIDTPERETWKYGEAGAEIVTGAAMNETAIFVKRKLSLKELVTLLIDLDYLLLEGFEDEKTIARIVTANNAAEAQEFYNDLTIAISGIITEHREEMEKASKLGVPIFNCRAEIEKLADLVEHKSFPFLPNLNCGECGYGSCHELAKAIVAGFTNLRECPLFRREDIILEVNGKIIPLKSFPALIIKRALIGMVSSLNGVDQIREIKIMVKAT